MHVFVFIVIPILFQSKWAALKIDINSFYDVDSPSTSNPPVNYYIRIISLIPSLLNVIGILTAYLLE